MIINNTHVRGMFLYSENVEYEKGDFVIVDEYIYICTAKNPTNLNNNTVSGINPLGDTTGNFIIYLGDKVISVDEFYRYKNFEDNPENLVSLKDKYVSSEVLNSVLENMIFGVDDNGIITENIIDENNYSDNIREAILNVSGENILDKIISSNSINNGYIRVSRDLVRELSRIPTESIDSIDGKSVILKQYTYLEGDNYVFRVQELIDHIYGITLYRYGKGSYNSEGNLNIDSIVPWKRSFLNKSYLEDINSVYKWFSDKVISLNREKNELQGNFKYCSLNIEKSNIVSLNSTDFKNLSNFNEDCIITITIQSLFSTDIFKNDSITLNIADSLSVNPITSYYIDKDLLLNVSDISESSVKLKVSSGVITNIFYRQNFLK